MTISFKLDENDYLQYHLFNDSKSSRIKKRRRSGYVWFIIIVACMFFIFSQNPNRTPAFRYIGLITAFSFVLLYPFYTKWFYKNHYKKFVKETYKNCFGEISTISFTENFIEVTEITGETKIKLTEIEEVFETAQHFFINIRNESALNIPKMGIENVDELGGELIKITGRLNIQFVSDLNWKEK